MKLFRIEVKNDRRWTSSGALSRDFYLLAGDVMQAMVFADDIVREIKERVAAAQIEFAPDLESLTVRTISEMGVVLGNSVEKYDDGLEAWLCALVESVKARD